MLVKNEILWYKLSIRRIELIASSDANGGAKREDRRAFRESCAGEKNFI
jgi:hypothetical protein